MKPLIEAHTTFASFAGISPIVVAIMAVVIAYRIVRKLLEEFEETLSEIS